MPIDVLMPAISPTMEKGTLLHWMKRVGDPVRVGDVLLEVETDKATMDVEATAAGTLSSILVPQGTVDVPVNERIGIIVGDTEAQEYPAPGPEAPTAGVLGAGATEANAIPPALADLLASRAGSNGEHRIFVSPIARRLIKEAGLDPRDVSGSGPHGRIVERDVTAVLGLRPQPEPADLVQAPDRRSPPDALLADSESNRFDAVPHDAMRRTIARRLTLSKQSVPHFYLAADCRVDGLLALRGEINGGGESLRVSVNDLLIKALARALAEVPEANVSFTEDAMLRHRHVDIAVAVAIEGGLMTPVVTDADAKPLSMISAEMRDLSARARERRLRPEEYQGGTAGLSNLGMYGVRDFAAILNPPQATMLAIGAAEKRMIVLEDGTPAVATMLTATLSADHRAVDGAAAARLLSRFKALLQAPITILV